MSTTHQLLLVTRKHVLQSTPHRETCIFQHSAQHPHNVWQYCLEWLGSTFALSLQFRRPSDFRILDSWVASPVDSEYIQPSWMMVPVSNLMGAATASSVDPDYYEWGWYLFGIGTIIWLALWPITFSKVGR